MSPTTDLPYACKITDELERPTLSVRTRAAVQDLPQLFGPTYAALMQYMSEMGAQPAGEPFAAYYDLDMQNLDIEIGFPVSKLLPDRGDIRSGTLPAGKYATAMNIGPYDTVSLAYKALTRYVKENGCEPAGVLYEFYFSGPETPPEEIQTQVMLPLKTG